MITLARTKEYNIEKSATAIDSARNLLKMGHITESELIIVQIIFTNVARISTWLLSLEDTLKKHDENFLLTVSKEFSTKAVVIDYSNIDRTFLILVSFELARLLNSETIYQKYVNIDPERLMKIVGIVQVKADAFVQLALHEYESFQKARNPEMVFLMKDYLVGVISMFWTILTKNEYDEEMEKLLSKNILSKEVLIAQFTEVLIICRDAFISEPSTD